MPDYSWINGNICKYFSIDYISKNVILNMEREKREFLG